MARVFRLFIYFNTYLSGISLGSAWTQYSYDKSISDDGQSVNANIYGHFDYYLLIDTSLTKLAGKDKQYYMTFNL